MPLAMVLLLALIACTLALRPGPPRQAGVAQAASAERLLSVLASISAIDGGEGDGASMPDPRKVQLQVIYCGG